jgi:flagellar basal body-associated protein FliL
MTAKPGVVYLLRDRFQLYSPFLRQIVEFKFTPAMVLDLDVLNDELLEEQITVFLTNGKVPASEVIFILSDNSYFVKDILATPPAPQQQKPGQPAPPPPKVSEKDLQPQIDTFVEHVPYENVVSLTFPLKNGVRVCAVNRDLFKSVQRAFEKLNFKVTYVLPGMVLGGGMSAKPVMDGMLANTAIQKAAALKQYDLRVKDPFSPTSTKQEEQSDEVQEELESSKEPPKTNKKRLVLMIGVLVALLVILVIVYMQSQQPPPAAQQAASANQPTLMPSVAAATTAPQPTEAVTTAQTQLLAVQIVHASSAVSDAQVVRSALSKFTFKSITTQTQNSIGTPNTIVTFTSKTPQSVRNAVLEEVRKSKSDLTVQETQSGVNDITIIIGK